VGLALGAILLLWRSLPWWISSPVTVVVFVGTVGFTLQRSVGLPF
jgi:hypothetical protein